MKWLHQRTNTPQPSRNLISMCVSNNKCRIHVVTLEKIMSFVFSAKSTVELIVEGYNKSGCGNILGIICWFWELCFSIFFSWFQLEVETFQVGVGWPCKKGRPSKKKTVEGVWGRARSLPPKFGRPCVRNFLSIPKKKILCPSIHMFLCLVFIRVLGP